MNVFFEDDAEAIKALPPDNQRCLYRLEILEGDAMRAFCDEFKVVPDERDIEAHVLWRYLPDPQTWAGEWKRYILTNQDWEALYLWEDHERALERFKAEGGLEYQSEGAGSCPRRVTQPSPALVMFLKLVVDKFPADSPTAKGMKLFLKRPKGPPRCISQAELTRVREEQIDQLRREQHGRHEETAGVQDVPVVEAENPAGQAQGQEGQTQG